jgi:hypothetical protein
MPGCNLTELRMPNETQDQRLRMLSEFAACRAVALAKEGIAWLPPFGGIPVGDCARAVTSNQMCRPQYSNGSAAPVDCECYTVNKTGTIRR